MDWSTAIKEVIDSHKDQKEISSKLKNWVTGQDDLGASISTVEFDFADGTSKVLPTIPAIVALAGGADTKNAYENIYTGDIIKLYNDGGIYKARKMRKGSFNSEIMANGTGSVYSQSILKYDEAHNKYVLFYVDTDYKLYGKVGTINENTGVLSFGASILLNTPDGGAHGFLLRDAFYCSGDVNSGVFVIVMQHEDASDALSTLIVTCDGTTLIPGTRNDSLGTYQYVDAKYLDVLNKLYLIYTNSSTKKIRLQVATINSGAGTITYLASPIEVKTYTTSNFNVKLCIDKNNKNIVLLYDNCNATDQTVYLNTFGPYDSSPSLGTEMVVEEHVISTDLTIFQTLEFDKDNDKIIYGLNTVGTFYIGSFMYNATGVNNLFRTQIYKTSGQGYLNIDVENNKYIFRNKYGDNLTVLIGLINNGVLNNIQIGNFTVSGNTHSISKTPEGKNMLLVSYMKPDFALYTRSIFMDERDEFYGIAQETKMAGQDVAIASLCGLSNAHSGLIPGKKYYLQEDLNIGLNYTPFFLGIAQSDSILKLN